MPRHLLTLLIVAFTVSLYPADMRGQERDDRLTTDLYLEWESVSDPRISPDGSQIIYTRRWVDKMNDRWESALWIMDVDGSRNDIGAYGGPYGEVYHPGFAVPLGCSPLLAAALFVAGAVCLRRRRRRQIR